MDPGKTKAESHCVVKFGYYGFVTLVVLGILYCGWLLFEPLLASVLLTFLLDPLVKYFETKGFKRLHVVLGICVVLVLMTLGVVVFVVPGLIEEAQNFAREMPRYKERVRGLFATLQQFAEARFPRADVPDLYAMVKSRSPGRHGVDLDAVLNCLSSFFAVLSVVVIVPIVTFFFLVDGHLIQKAFLRLVPNCYFEMMVLLLHRVTSSVKFFIRGQMIDAAAVGIMTTVGLAWIGLPYFLVIGMVAGVGNLIPYLGPIIGFVPAFLVVLVSPEGLTAGSLVSVIAVFVIVQFLEGTFVYPIAVGKSVNLHPLVVIVGITIGGQLSGILGMLIAIPLICVVKVSIEVLFSYLKAYSII